MGFVEEEFANTLTFIASNLRKLSRASFPVANAGGAPLMFELPADVYGIARSGNEAFGFPITCYHPDRGPLSSFMKIFREEVPERDARAQFLVLEKGLAASHPWMFHGVPYTVIGRGTQINGVYITGHVALQIGAAFGKPAEDFQRLKAQDKWDGRYIPETRKFLAAQLCAAVATMEESNFVHGDLSPGNIMIGPGPTDGQPICTLCDFDGFFHPQAPNLPRMFRPLGSPGYQYPDLQNRISADKGMSETIRVETDRFALAALVCELVIWSPDLPERLGRGNLLPDQVEPDALRNGSYIRDDVRSLWPEGFILLDCAFQASDVGSMPSPEAWLRLFGVNVGFNVFPRLEIYEGPIGHDSLIKDLEIVTKTKGDLGIVNDTFGQVGFVIEERAKRKVLTLEFGWDKPILLQRPKRKLDKFRGPCKVPVNPGDTILSDRWRIVAHDGSRS
jgi:hypothetical protein